MMTGVWIGETNTKVIEVAAEHAGYGWEAEEIHAAHPYLALAQIHAALSFYYDHKAEKAFYQDVFNLKKLDSGEGDAFFKLGEHQ